MINSSVKFDFLFWICFYFANALSHKHNEMHSILIIDFLSLFQNVGVWAVTIIGHGIG